MRVFKLIIPLFILFFSVQSCHQDQDNAISDPLTGFEVNESEIEPALEDQAFGFNFVSAAPVINPINGDEKVGIAKLFRYGRGVAMRMRSKALIPGHTYTIWWVAFNNPENCGAAPCAEADIANPAVKCEIMYATGKVIESGTEGLFWAYLKEDDSSGSINTLFGLPEYGGLLNSYQAEVHLVVRSHGPIIEGQVEEQIGSFNGGCSTSLPAFTEVPDEEGECADIQFAIFEAN